MTNAIEASGLVKRFGKTTALAGVDLVARPGTVLGVLGPNGAGKTTAVRILATLLRPDGGQARVCGYDVGRQAHQVRQLIGLTGQYASVDEGLSGVNNLIMIGRLLGESRGQARARASELLDRFDLTEAAGRPVKTYSGGMRRRLDLAASLVGRPRVLYLDEPTTGLDPRSRSDVWDMIGAAGRRGPRRHGALHDLGGDHPRLRHGARLPDRDQPGGGRRGLPAAAHLRPGHVLGVGADRDARQDTAGRADVRVPRDVPAGLRQQPAGALGDDAGLAAGVREGQPDDRPHQRRARARVAVPSWPAPVCEVLAGRCQRPRSRGVRASGPGQTAVP